MAVVRVVAGRPRLELVGDLVSRLHDLEDAVHVGWMDAVEVDRVRVRARVREVDAEDVPLGGAQDRTGNGAVVRPRREEDAGSDLELAVERAQVVLADPPRLVRERRRRVEERVEVVRAADGGRVLADHRSVSRGGVVVDVVLQHPVGGIGVAVERELAEDGRRDDRRCAGQQSPPRKFRHA
jgi:hypothetical protein